MSIAAIGIAYRKLKVNMLLVLLESYTILGSVANFGADILVG